MALTGQIPQNSLFISLLAGNLQWRRASDRLRPQPAIPVLGEYCSLSYKCLPNAGFRYPGQSPKFRFPVYSGKSRPDSPANSEDIPDFWSLGSETEE